MTTMQIDRAVVEQALKALEGAAECVQQNYLPDKCGHDWDEQITALRAALAQQVKTCAWRDNLDAIYETECGNLHIVNDGTLEENGMKYCCYCGKEIKDESPT